MPRTRRPGSAPVTVDGKPVPKYARVAAAVKSQIAEGILRPGQAAPSGAALSRVTGYSTLTCRRALRVLVADGVLLPGPSRNARPRVAGPPQQPGERDLAAAARALSGGLAGRRRAKGLTQPELAAILGMSVTTVGHAETGRLWQSRQFWEQVDAVLGADGDLLRLHEAYGEASASSGADAPASAEQAVTAAGAAAAARPGACPTAGAHLASGQVWPACVVITWGDGSVTTVHPPGMPPPETAPAGPPPAGMLAGETLPGEASLPPAARTDPCRSR